MSRGATGATLRPVGYGRGIDRQGFEAWIALYERAWRTPGTALLAELFVPGATYTTAPFREPHRGLAAIEELWEEERDGAEEPFTLGVKVLAVEGEIGVAQAEVVYEQPRKQYRDLWIVRFDGEGRAISFEEWFASPPGDG